MSDEHEIEDVEEPVTPLHPDAVQDGTEAGEGK